MFPKQINAAVMNENNSHLGKKSNHFNARAISDSRLTRRQHLVPCRPWSPVGRSHWTLHCITRSQCTETYINTLFKKKMAAAARTLSSGLQKICPSN